MSNPERLPLRRLILFWLPLALMWLIMGIEQPAMNAVVARLPEPERSLAGFEVAFGIATLIHGPIVQMLSAATAIVRGRRSYQALRKLLQRLVASLTGVHVVLALPAIFSLLAGKILGVPSELVPVANIVFAILIPFTGVVGYRRFYQGALIQAGRTRIVSMTMVIRLAVTVLTLVAGLVLSRTGVPWAPPGYVVAATAFLAGLVAGLIVARWWFFRDLYPSLADDPDDAWSTARLLRFYLPLAFTSLIFMLSRPLVASAMARAEYPVRSLAAWPLIQNYVFIFTAIGLSFQEVVIARRRDGGLSENRELMFLALIIAGSLVSVYAAAWMSGATDVWYRSVMAAPDTLLPLIRVTMSILLPIPVLVVLLSSLNGILVSRRATLFVTLSTIANAAAQLALALLLPTGTQLPGTAIASLMNVTAMTLQAFILVAGVRFSGRSRGSGGLHADMRPRRLRQHPPR